MLKVLDLNEIARLEKNYKKAQDLLSRANYDKHIDLIINNAKRRAIESLLKAEKYAELAKFHTKELYEHNHLITIDLYKLAIQSNQEQTFKDILKFNGFSERKLLLLISDFFKEAEEALFHLSRSEEQQTILKQIQDEQSYRENTVVNAQNDYDAAIKSAITTIGSQLKQRQLTLLVESNAIHDDTIGHLCLRGDAKNQNLYINLLLTLDSKNILTLLYCRNRSGVSILDLYLKTNNRFLRLASALDSNDLYTLLSKDNLFLNIITIKKNVLNFLKEYLQLLKEKCNEYQLSQLLNLDCDSLAPADNGWTIGHEIIKQQNASRVLEYIDLLSGLPKEKLQHRLHRKRLINPIF